MTPRELGFRMPAEWEPHAATWVSWPHEPTTWPEKLAEAEGCVARWVRALTRSGERVEVNVLDAAHEARVQTMLARWDVDPDRVGLHRIPTADAWIRDYGPTFVVNGESVAAVGWLFDAWGGKGDGYYGDRASRDGEVPRRIAQELSMQLFEPGIVLEGGSIDVNGAGTLMATRDCLLSHRQRADAQADVEQKLYDYLGAEHVLWLENVPFDGDDTDGHVDNLARFVGPRTIATVVADDRAHPLYRALQENLRRLERGRTESGHPVEVVPVPLPAPFYYHWCPPSGRARQQFPASYMNFYIGNEIVLMPTYADPHDATALDLLGRCFPTHRIIPIDCCDYILGQGAIHCSTQQQPAVSARDADLLTVA